jgi:hypothetical protein
MVVSYLVTSALKPNQEVQELILQGEISNQNS